MKHLIRILAITIYFSSLSCNQQPDPLQTTPNSERLTKDLVTFQLPKSVVEVSEIAQSHFLELLPYNSARFQVKPRFVFIDRSEKIVGPSSSLVTELNFLHAAYFREGALVWRGSLLYGRQENPLCATREGFHLGVNTTDSGIRVTFQDGERRFETQLSSSEDVEQWLGDPNAKLYLYSYVVHQGMLNP